MASLFKSGLDIRREYGSASGTGVERFYQIVTEAGLVHDFFLPEIGDLIFWDNTHDRNGDKAWNDQLTHVGLVIAVDDDGTITYLHHDYRRGIIKAYMNLLAPDLGQVKQEDGSIKIYNSAMRMSSQRYLNPDRWLASHLFRSFARIHLWDTASLLTGN